MPLIPAPQSVPSCISLSVVFSLLPAPQSVPSCISLSVVFSLLPAPQSVPSCISLSVVFSPLPPPAMNQISNVTPVTTRIAATTFLNSAWSMYFCSHAPAQVPATRNGAISSANPSTRPVSSPLALNSTNL